MVDIWLEAGLGEYLSAEILEMGMVQRSYKSATSANEMVVAIPVANPLVRCVARPHVCLRNKAHFPQHAERSIDSRHVHVRVLRPHLVEDLARRKVAVLVPQRRQDH
jgi:hypothetical protein